MENQRDTETGNGKEGRTKDQEEMKSKILVVSSFYPPHHVDEPDSIYRKLGESLKAEGYAVHVVTSNFVHPSQQKFGLYPVPYPGKHRDLQLEFAADSGQADLSPAIRNHNISVVKKILQDFSPDAIVEWNMKRFSDTFWAEIRVQGIPDIEKAQILSANDEIEALRRIF